VAWVKRNWFGAAGPPVGAAGTLKFAVVAGMAVHRGPISGIVASPDGDRVILSNYGDHSVSIIDTGTWAGVTTITGISEPFTVAMSAADPSHAYLGTASAAYDAIAVVDLETSSVVASHPLALTVTDLAVSSDGRHVYVSRTAPTGADVAILDTAIGRIEVIDIGARAGTTTECLRLTPDGRLLYVATQRPAGGEVVVIDTHLRRVVDTIDIGCAIRDLAISPDGRTAFVVSSDIGLGVVVDTVDTRSNQIISTRKLSETTGGSVTQLVLSSDRARGYLVGDDKISVVCTLTQDVIGTIAAGRQPSCVAESPGGHYLYVADYSGAVTVVSIDPATASPNLPGEDDCALRALGRHAAAQLEPALA
jgi:YVTN family beta-propeller protein